MPTSAEIQAMLDAIETCMTGVNDFNETTFIDFVDMGSTGMQQKALENLSILFCNGDCQYER